MITFSRHFISWFFALFVFAFFEWRHPGFVSFVLPFPVLILLPGLILLAGYVWEVYRKTDTSKS